MDYGQWSIPTVGISRRGNRNGLELPVVQPETRDKHSRCCDNDGVALLGRVFLIFYREILVC
jgi:hypothetical protein